MKRPILKFIANALLGAAALAAINLTGWDIQLGLTWFNVLIVAALGLPGLGVLLLARYLF
ncbi:hypothetical protein FACS18949_08180 [Clostridia bacterium]|nr:hypothetical protein FACS18949_08180 [Clostridia bacterium]